MITPIYSRLKDYRGVSSRFHTPGHSGVNIDDILYRSSNLDITELSFSDNLACPKGIIAQAEQLMAKQYKCLYTLFLTNGGSGAVFIAVAIIKNYGSKILVGNNTHVSVFRAARVFGLEVICVDDDKIIDKCEIEQDIAAVLVTTPDYYGRATDCKKLREYLNKKGVLYVIDHSHGMHYIYSDKLPESMTDKADIVIGSLHKTLPVMTGGAILAINREDLYNHALYNRMNLHSTSPSYLIMASMDFARAYMSENGQMLYNMLFKRVDMIQDELIDSKFLVKDNDDFTRLSVICEGMSGYSVYRELEKKDIHTELADNNQIISILTPFNADKISDLINALREIKADDKPLDTPNYRATKTTNTAFCKVDFVTIEESLGHVVMSEIAIYPPAVTLLRSGDIIDREAIDILLRNRKYIIGLVKGLVPVIK